MDVPRDPIRVMTVDDHRLLRDGLRFLLLAFDDIALVGEARDGNEALEKCGQVRPDVVLMDMMMPGMHGIDATRMLKEQYPGVQVLILSSFHDRELVQRAVQAGAIGYLLKDVSIDELADGIRAANAGKPVLGADVAQDLVRPVDAQGQPSRDLTERQAEVLALMAEGLSNRAIAERLVLSPYTVRNHVSEILSRLGVTSRTEAAALAVRQGLVR
ncbi:MAG: response regulator [Anaerolineae bacterium]|jgi:NarL family two-component system response regulator LiaR